MEEEEGRGLRVKPLESQHLGDGPRKKNPQRILKGSLGTTKMVEGGPGRTFRGRMEPGHPMQVDLSGGVCYRHRDTYVFVR